MSREVKAALLWQPAQGTQVPLVTFPARPGSGDVAGEPSSHFPPRSPHGLPSLDARPSGRPCSPEWTSESGSNARSRIPRATRGLLAWPLELTGVSIVARITHPRRLCPAPACHLTMSMSYQLQTSSAPTPEGQWGHWPRTRKPSRNHARACSEDLLVGETGITANPRGSATQRKGRLRTSSPA